MEQCDYSEVHYRIRQRVQERGKRADLDGHFCEYVVRGGESRFLAFFRGESANYAGTRKVFASEPRYVVEFRAHFFIFRKSERKYREKDRADNDRRRQKYERELHVYRHRHYDRTDDDKRGAKD